MLLNGFSGRRETNGAVFDFVRGAIPNYGHKRKSRKNKYESPQYMPLLIRRRRVRGVAGQLSDFLQTGLHIGVSWKYLIEAGQLERDLHLRPDIDQHNRSAFLADSLIYGYQHA